MVSSNTKGNPNHDELGRFASSPGGGADNTSAPDSANAQAKQMPAWLKKKADDGTKKSSPMWEKVKKNRWWKERTVRDAQYIVDNIGEYFEDDMLDEMEKAGFSAVDKNHTFFSSSTARTSHNYINEVLTNLIAKKMFHPITEVDSSDFTKQWNLAQGMVGGDYTKFPYADVGCVTRGVHNRTDRIADALGETNNSLVLPNGAYGSCIYTAYDNSTAKSYAGSRGYVFKMLVDNKNGNTITSSDYNSVRQQFISRLPEMEDNLRAHLQSKGKDDNYCDKAIRMFDNTARQDDLFPAIIMGYDCVYEQGFDDYALILNYKHVKVKKEW